MITENENNYFGFNFKKATNLGKLFLLPKIHKGLWKVPGQPVTSNCGTPTEKVSELLNDHLQAIMIQGETTGEAPKGANVVTADVAWLYPSIPHSEGLDILKNSMKSIPIKSIYRRFW